MAGSSFRATTICCMAAVTRDSVVGWTEPTALGQHTCRDGIGGGVSILGLVSCSPSNTFLKYERDEVFERTYVYFRGNSTK